MTIDELQTEIKSEAADCRAIDNPQGAAAAQMLDAWGETVRVAGETIAARNTLLRHVREALLVALDNADRQVRAGTAPAVIVSDLRGALDKVLPPRKKK